MTTLRVPAGSLVDDTGGKVTVTIPTSGGGGGVTVADEGTPLATTGTTLDFVGAGVTASGTGATKTITIPGGGSGTFPIGLAMPDTIPASAGTYDEEFEGTADTLPANWAWEGTAPSFDLNDDFPSWLVALRPVSTSTEYSLVRSSFAPGGGPWGIWARMSAGGHAGGYNMSFRMYVSDADDSEAIYIKWEMSQSALSGYSRVSNSDSQLSGAGAPAGMLTGYYFGITRAADGKWSAWYSNDGVGWRPLSQGTTNAFTPDRLRFVMTAADGNVSPIPYGIDWVRSRADVNFPHP